MNAVTLHSALRRLRNIVLCDIRSGYDDAAIRDHVIALCRLARRVS